MWQSSLRPSQPISTHYLTQRQTPDVGVGWQYSSISTHYLTQRQTDYSSSFCCPMDHFNSLPHTEVDYTTSRTGQQDIYFNSLPHTEVDPLYAFSLYFIFYFNSLPHTEVDVLFLLVFFRIFISTHYLTQRQTNPYWTACKFFTFQLTTSHRGRLLALHLLKSRSKFQLTTSHRGRQWKRVLENPKKNFNSLPHTEVDGKKQFLQSHKVYFNSLPHTEVDLLGGIEI